MDLPTGTITLVFTDIQESSELSERFRADFEPLRAAHFRLLREALGPWNGREVSTAGDALFLVFENASDAVQWAVEVQRSLAAYDWPRMAAQGEAGGEPERVELRVRIGMHTGEPYLTVNAGRPDYFGPAVNRASRVSSAAHGGQVLISSATHALVQYALQDGVSLLDRGRHRLKGVGEDQLWQIAAPGLAEEFPPLKTLDPQRHNLPAPPTPYLGRDEEIADWLRRLRDPATRILTLTGFGGMGKTRSALQLAELSLDDYPDGVVWVETEEARTGDEMIQRIAAALNLPPPPFREQVVRYLHDRELLLILDNTEQVEDAGRVVKDLLGSAPRMKFLVTSRRALEIQAERVIEISPMKISEAVQLFVGRVRDRQPAFELTPENEHDVAELCARLDGVPLALELAASRIALMSPRQMLQRLSERFKLLQTRAPDLPERQRALRAAIDWSYDLLGDGEKSLFARLSVFAGGFALEDAEAVADDFDALEGIAELRRHSLLRSEVDEETQQTRFLMLNSLREYAQERLDAGPDAAATRLRHARYFLEVARERLERMRTPGEAAAQRDLALNEDNLRAAMEYAQSYEDLPLFAELGLLSGRALSRRGYSERGSEPVRAAIDAVRPHRTEHTALLASLVEEHAGLLTDQQLWDPAAAVAREAMLLYAELGDKDGGHRVLSLLGTAAWGLGDHDSARVHLEKALESERLKRDESLLAMVYNNLGLALDGAGAESFEEAGRYFRLALELRRKRGDARGIAETLNNLGILAFRQSQWEQAWSSYAEALVHERAVGDTLGIARGLFNLAEVAEQRADSEAALRLAAASECLMDRIKSPLIHYPVELIERVASDAAAHCRADDLRQEACGQPIDSLATWAMGPGE